MGHSAGDAVLKEVAARLKATCGNAVMVARLGGDEFVALLPGDDVRMANAIAEQLVAAISAPLTFAGEKIEIGVSIGVALSPLHSARSEELLSAADLALYKAKAAGRGRYELFTPAIREVAVVRRAFERELKLAFENNEFELFYQPQVMTRTRALTGAEALMRWNHPERGLLSPASFMDVLSQKPSAASVGEWVLRTACRQAAEWRTQIPNFRIGVNLFEAQFRAGRLLTMVREALDESKLPAEALELEIVENILLRDDRTTLKLLHDLRDLGVGLAFDDLRDRIRLTQPAQALSCEPSQDRSFFHTQRQHRSGRRRGRERRHLSRQEFWTRSHRGRCRNQSTAGLPQEKPLCWGSGLSVRKADAGERNLPAILVARAA